MRRDDTFDTAFAPKAPPARVLRREAAIVRARDAGWTLQEIGDEQGCTRERIRQIEKRARAREVSRAES